MSRRRIIVAVVVATLCFGGTATTVAWWQFSEGVAAHTGPSGPDMCVPGGIALQSSTTATRHHMPVLRAHRGEDITVDLVAQPIPDYSKGQGEVLSEVTVDLRMPSDYDPVHDTSPPSPPRIFSEVSTPEFQPHVDLGSIAKPGRYRIFVGYTSRFTSGVCAKPGSSGGGSGVIGFVVVR